MCPVCNGAFYVEIDPGGFTPWEEPIPMRVACPECSCCHCGMLMKDHSPWGSCTTPRPMPELLDGPEYRTLEWTDETSCYDDHPSVKWGGSCYLRKMRVRVPAQLTDDEAFEWIDQQSPEDLVWLD